MPDMSQLPQLLDFLAAGGLTLGLIGGAVAGALAGLAAGGLGGFVLGKRKRPAAV